MIIEFPEYLPDLPIVGNPGLIQAMNVIPAGNSYRPAKNTSALTKSVPGGISNSYDASGTVLATVTSTFHIQGAFSTKLPTTGNSVNFCGDSKGLYILNQGNSEWSDVRKASANYGTVSTERWEFTQFNNQLVATNFNDTMQLFTLGTSTRFGDLSADTDMPKARYIDTVRNFLVVGNTSLSSVNSPNRVQWSGIGDPTIWGTVPENQADFQDLPGKYGPIRGIVGGEYGTVFQETGITRMNYVGSPLIFSFETVETNRGTRYPGSIVAVGDLRFYMGIDGFYVFSGSTSTAIGVNKVDRTFFSMIDKSYPERIYGAVDYEKYLICWCVPLQGSGDGVPGQLIYYNFAPNSKNRFTYTRQQLDMIYTAITGGYTVDTADDYLSQIGGASAKALGVDYPGLQDVDSNFWIASNLILGAFDTDDKLASFTGSPLAGELEFSDRQFFEGQRAELNLMRPLVDGRPLILSGSNTVQAATKITMRVGERNNLSDEPTYKDNLVQNSIGDVPLRSNARYQRIKVTIENDYDDALGVAIVDVKEGGYR